MLKSKRTLLDRDGHTLEPVNRSDVGVDDARKLVTPVRRRHRSRRSLHRSLQVNVVVADGDVTSTTILLRHLPVAAGTLFTYMRVISVWFMLMSGPPSLLFEWD